MKLLASCFGDETLDLNCEQTVSNRQADQKMAHDKHSKLRELTVGEGVMAQNNKQGLLHVPAVVKKKLGPLT